MARQVGVDRSTVSLVLGGKAAGRVAPEVQATIRRVAEELGYRPDASARALRLGPAEALALVVPQATNPFFAPLLHGATLEATKAGVELVVVKRPEATKGFILLPQVVERSLAWLLRFRRLGRDLER